MPAPTLPTHRIAVSDLRAAPDRHAGEADAAAREALRERFGLLAVDALKWTVESAPWRSGVRLTGRIEARVTQECVVTLEPVPEVVDAAFERGFVPFADLYSEDKAGSEHEIVNDSELGDIPEELVDPLDIGEVVAEELGVALDPYPRKEGLEEEASYSVAPEGVKPITDADVKPFASLADLKKRMEADNNGD